MAPPHKIQKQLVENNNTNLEPSGQACTRTTCCNKKSKGQGGCQKSNASGQNSTASKLTQPAEINSGKLITNIKPVKNITGQQKKLVTSGATLSNLNTNYNTSEKSSSKNKNTDSTKTLVTVLKAKENRNDDLTKNKHIEGTSVQSPVSVKRSKKPDNVLAESTKKVKRKKFTASAANKKRRSLIHSVNQAIKSRKIFMINSLNPRAFPSIRSALKERGWVEKSACETLEPGMHSKNSEIVLRILRDIPAYFHWSTTYVDFCNINNIVTTNRFPKNIHFTSKVGLCTFLEDFYWFYDETVSVTIFPHTFNVANERDLQYFTQYYVLSACISLMKIVVETVNSGEPSHLFKDGNVPLDAVDFAVGQCDAYIRFKEHRDIDTINETVAGNKDYSNFLNWFYEIAQRNGAFTTMTHPVIHAIYMMCKTQLQKIQPYWDLIHLEGVKNLWIIKPANSNCGKGIYIKKELEELILHVNQKVDSQFGRFVIQKYIERPLLIFNTKFDIRQWFLITSVYPLHIWIYVDCYLRFSSQQFSLDNLHKSVHLTNNSVQCYYTNGERDPELPEENMWHCQSFKRYLHERGLLSKWDDIILPGMYKAIVGAVLASQDELIERSKSFELYGADFLLGEDFTTILIEINSGPCMRYTTSVTEKMCKECLEDVIKVVVDRKNDSTANTGKFKILYKQEMGPKFNSCGMDMTVVGKKIKPTHKFTSKTVNHTSIEINN